MASVGVRILHIFQYLLINRTSKKAIVFTRHSINRWMYNHNYTGLDQLATCTLAVYNRDVTWPPATVAYTPALIILPLTQKIIKQS